ncbi:MAG: hypothetical protein ABSG39_07415 [Acidimicrobiales bacterium]|jgi:hypothetical protein
MVGVDWMPGRTSRLLGGFDVLHFHDVDHDGAIFALDQKGQFVGTPFIQKGGQTLLSSWPIHLGKPLTKLVGLTGIDVTYCNSKHSRSIANFTPMGGALIFGS